MAPKNHAYKMSFPGQYQRLGIFLGYQKRQIFLDKVSMIKKGSLQLDLNARNSVERIQNSHYS